MFRPEEVIFAPTSRCNLACAHCRVTRTDAGLSPDAAIRFLESCRDGGIELVGFSGGEPFLAPDFLERVVRAAVGYDLRFDRLMTNACWFRDRTELRDRLDRLADAGFDGTLGVSFDRWHGQEPETVALFIEESFAAFGRKDCVEIVAVDDRAGKAPLDLLETLSGRLGAALELDGDRPLRLFDPLVRDDDPSGYDDPDRLVIPVVTLPYSPAASEDAWGDGPWFEDDYCEGPGNVLYVHPDGSVAVCCGFANECPELVVGNIATDGCDALLRNARGKPQVRACYETGLATVRKALEASGTRFPGTTADPCFFCDWLCANRVRLP